MVGRGVPDSGIGVGSAPSEDGGTIHDQIACTDEAARELVSSEVSFPYFFRVRKCPLVIVMFFIYITFGLDRSFFNRLIVF